MIKLATLALFTLAASSQAAVIISEVHSTGSSQTATDTAAQYATDFFELYNNGSAEVDLTGWKMDDNSYAFANSVGLDGVTLLPPGSRAVFIEASKTSPKIDAFKTAWFGSNVPNGLLLGTYNGTNVSLSSGGDAVIIFDSAGAVQAAVSFGAATAGITFDNAAGITGTANNYVNGTNNAPAISTLSVAGTNSAFNSAVVNSATGNSEVGSPGVPVPEPTTLGLASVVALFGLGKRVRRA